MAIATPMVQTGAAAHRRADLALATAAGAGLMVGIAESLFFAYALARSPLERALGRNMSGANVLDIVDLSALILMSLAPIGVGVAFAWLLRRPVALWRVALAGVSLLVASLLGVVIAAGFEAIGSSVNVLLLFRAAFTLASGTAALLCTWSVARLLRIDGALPKALLVGAATAGVYLAFVLLIDLQPGWRVGGGDMAMPRVAMLGNLISGTLGGTLAFRLLHR